MTDHPTITVDVLPSAIVADLKRLQIAPWSLFLHASGEMLVFFARREMARGARASIFVYGENKMNWDIMTTYPSPSSDYLAQGKAKSIREALAAIDNAWAAHNAVAA